MYDTEKVYDFGFRLKELREKRNLTQAQVAQRLGVRRATISGYENNTTSPSLQRVAELALMYRTTADYLLGIDNRRIIMLDGLTEKEANFIERLAENAIAELKILRL